MILLPSYIFGTESEKSIFWFDKELKICWIYIKTKSKIAFMYFMLKCIYRTCTFTFVDEFKSSVGDEGENSKKFISILMKESFQAEKSCLRNA